MSSKKQLKKKQAHEVKRIVQYFISGGAWFWSGYILIVLLDDVIGLFLANVVGNGVGLTINFFLNHYWVFKEKRQASLKTTTSRYIIYTGLNAFVLNYLILLGLQSIGVKPEIGQFIASGFFSVWNYFWYRAWVFKNTVKPKHIGGPHALKEI